MSAATHKAQVLQHLKSGASLTPRQSQDLFGRDRLAARIAELRAEGYDIVDDRRIFKTRYSIYRLRTIEDQGLLMPLPSLGRPE